MAITFRNMHVVHNKSRNFHNCCMHSSYTQASHGLNWSVTLFQDVSYFVLKLSACYMIVSGYVIDDNLPFLSNLSNVL